MEGNGKTMVVVSGEGCYHSVYGPFSSESERWDFVSHAERQGYTCQIVDVQKPFWEIPVKLISLRADR